MAGSRPSFIAIVIAGAAICYALAFAYPSGDLRYYLLPWYREIIAEGRIAVFAAPFGNYTPPYLYLLSAASLLDGWLRPAAIIKLVAISSGLFLVWSAYRLHRAAGTPRAAEAAAWLLLLPSVFFNTALQGQADAIWTGLCVLAVMAALMGDTARMVVWIGLAFAFKAQAAFLSPFVFAVLIQRRAPLWQWLVPPAIYVAAMLPAVLVGWPLGDALTVYVRQAQWKPEFMGNAPNPWSWVYTLFPADAWRFAVVGYAAAGAAALAYVWRFRREKWEGGDMILAALLSALVLPFLLPKMHERYFMLADVLAFVLAFVARDRRAVSIALLVNTASGVTFLAFLIQRPVFILAAAFWMAAAIVLVAASVARRVQIVCNRAQIGPDIPVTF